MIPSSPVFAYEMLELYPTTGAGAMNPPAAPAVSGAPLEPPVKQSGALFGLPMAIPVYKKGKKCFCGRPTNWQIRFGKFLSPSICLWHFSPEERALVVLFAVSRGLAL